MMEERSAEAKQDHALEIEGEAASLRLQNSELQLQLLQVQQELEEKLQAT